jgi:hypothetical protein
VGLVRVASAAARLVLILPWRRTGWGIEAAQGSISSLRSRRWLRRVRRLLGVGERCTHDVLHLLDRHSAARGCLSEASDNGQRTHQKRRQPARESQPAPKGSCPMPLVVRVLALQSAEKLRRRHRSFPAQVPLQIRKLSRFASE